MDSLDLVPVSGLWPHLGPMVHCEVEIVVEIARSIDDMGEEVKSEEGWGSFVLEAWIPTYKQSE